ncbi:Alpha/Beta hydrolase protein [Pilobolus umbonatus]|nr:Alpha/Beta hydrolase protein [Pilobolus umbonatus]
MRLSPSYIIGIITQCLLCYTEASSITYQLFNSTINPNYSVRYVQPSLCDDSITQYSGYLDLGYNTHYFFWFFESRSQSEDVPLTVWLNGGPGCSSMLGLYAGMGPCRPAEDRSGSIYNPYSWSEYSHLLFIDQPSGTGFSYGNVSVATVQQGSSVFYDALQLFYEAFPMYRVSLFHLFGESYAGRYIPFYAEYIIEKNKYALESQFIPLVSVGIGNGWINPLIQYQYSSVISCDSSYGSVLSDITCSEMRNNTVLCMDKIAECYKTNKVADCLYSSLYCEEIVDNLFLSSGRSYYDIRKSSNASSPDGYIQLLNDPLLQTEIGVDNVKFEQCSDDVYLLMYNAGENVRDSSAPLISLLNQDIRVLLYVGDADYLCNWYGVYALTEALEFNGTVSYREQSLQPWMSEEREMGQIKSSDLLTFIRVYESGHVVTYDQPEVSLSMFAKWISYTSLS